MLPIQQRAFFNRKSKAADIHEEVEKAAKEAQAEAEKQENAQSDA